MRSSEWNSLVAAELRSFIGEFFKASIEVSEIFSQQSLVRMAQFAPLKEEKVENRTNGQTRWNQLVKTFAHQDSLPQMPVPDLRATLDGYIESIRLLQDDTAFQNSLSIFSLSKPKVGLAKFYMVLG